MTQSIQLRMVKCGIAVACLTLAHVAQSTASAQTLPEWVTLNGNSAQTGYVPMSVSPASARVLWSTRLPIGNASRVHPPVTGDGRAYVSTEVYFEIGYFAALNLADGSVLWGHRFESASYGGVPTLHAPAFKQGMAYVSTGGHADAALWGFDGATGTQQFRSPLSAQWDTYYSPTPQGDGLYMNGGYYGGAYGFDAVDGATKWFTSLPQYDRWTPATDDRYVYAYTTQLDVLNRRTGKVVTTINDPGFSWSGYSVGCAPVLGSRQNVIVTQNQRLISFDLASRSLAWEVSVPTDDYLMNQPSLADGTIYYGTGSTVYMLDEATGRGLGRWTVPGGGTIESTVVVTRNAFIVSANNGTYVVNRADTTQPARKLPAHGQLALSKQGVLVIAGADGTITGVRLR